MFETIHFTESFKSKKIVDWTGELCILYVPKTRNKNESDQVNAEATKKKNVERRRDLKIVVPGPCKQISRCVEMHHRATKRSRLIHFSEKVLELHNFATLLCRETLLQSFLQSPFVSVSKRSVV